MRDTTTGIHMHRGRLVAISLIALLGACSSNAEPAATPVTSSAATPAATSSDATSPVPASPSASPIEATPHATPTSGASVVDTSTCTALHDVALAEVLDLVAQAQAAFPDVTTLDEAVAALISDEAPDDGFGLLRGQLDLPWFGLASDDSEARYVALACDTDGEFDAIAALFGVDDASTLGAEEALVEERVTQAGAGGPLLLGLARRAIDGPRP